MQLASAGNFASSIFSGAWSVSGWQRRLRSPNLRPNLRRIVRNFDIRNASAAAGICSSKIYNVRLDVTQQSAKSIARLSHSDVPSSWQNVIDYGRYASDNRVAERAPSTGNLGASISLPKRSRSRRTPAVRSDTVEARSIACEPPIEPNGISIGFPPEKRGKTGLHQFYDIAPNFF